MMKRGRYDSHRRNPKRKCLSKYSGPSSLTPYIPSSATLIIGRSVVHWWRRPLLNATIVVNEGSDVVTRDGAAVICPLTLDTIPYRRAFYRRRVYFDAAAITRNCFLLAFTCPILRDEFSHSDVQRLIKVADNHDLEDAYKKRNEEAQRREEQQRLVDSYMAICDSIVNHLSHRIASWLVAFLPPTPHVTPANVAHVATGDDGWSSLWILILQYRGIHTQLGIVDASAANLLCLAHRMQLQRSHEVITRSMPCPPRFTRTCQLLCNFVASSLTSLTSETIVTSRLRRRNEVRNRRRRRFLAYSNM